MGRKRLPYREGSCFVVPLRNGGFARGVVARMSGNGIIFAYFFGPILESPGGYCSDLAADAAILRTMCGDLGMLKGAWKVIGAVESWHRDAWPLPFLFRRDPASRQAWLSRYDEDTLKVVQEISTSPDVEDLHPYDTLMGYGAVEIVLTRMLSGKSTLD